MIRLLILFLLLMVACGEPVKSVLGDWRWVESNGGLLPPVTPENSGRTARLKITRDELVLYENGQEVERRSIKIKRRSSGLILDSDEPNADKIINFLNDDEITMTYYDGRNTDCQDCSVRRYVRDSK